jgi:hypothetical protein
MSSKMKRLSVAAPQFLWDYLETYRNWREHKTGVRPSKAHAIRKLIINGLEKTEAPWDRPEYWGDPKQLRLVP